MITDKEYILCAAVLRLIPKTEIVRYHTCDDIYRCELRWRHHDIMVKFKGEVSSNPFDSGFFTSCGRFVDREEASVIAKKAGQIAEDKRVLYSEDLY